MAKGRGTIRSLYSPQWKGSFKDRQGQMAFSMVAVVLLLISGASVAIYSSSSQRSIVSQQDMEERQLICQEAFETVRELAYGIAYEDLNDTYVDVEKARLSFLLSFNETMRTMSPYVHGDHLVTIDARDIDIKVQSMPDSAQWMEGPGSPTFYLVSGEVRVNVSDEKGHLTMSKPVSADVYLPIPMLRERSALLQGISTGGGSVLWRCVRYELSCLMQLRALQDTDAGFSSTRASNLIQDQDVKNAVVLAIILQQRAVLNDFDQGLLSYFEPPPGEEIFTARITSLVEGSGPADPADIFLQLYGMNGFSLQSALAQSLYSSVDLLVLRFLEYFHVLDAIDLMELGMETGILIANDIVSWLLGQDILATHAIDWVRDRMSKAGYSEQEYRYLWTSHSDWDLDIAPFSVPLMNASGGIELVQLGGIVVVDLPEHDIFASSFWKDTYSEYIKGTGQTTECLKQLLRGIAQAVAERSESISFSLSLDPFDGTTPMEELEMAVEKTLGTSQGWFASSSSLVSIRPGPDPLGEAMNQALTLGSDRLFDRSNLMGFAIDTTAEQLYLNLMNENREYQFAPMDVNLETIRGSVESRPDIDLEIAEHYETDTVPIIQRLGESFLSSGSGDFAMNCLVTIASGLVTNSRPLEDWVEEQLEEMVDDTIISQGIGGMALAVNLPNDGAFVLSSGSRSIEVSIISTTVIDGLRVEVRDPVRYPEQLESFHMTDLRNSSHSPFQAEWEISIAGSFTTRLTAWNPKGLFSTQTQVVNAPLNSFMRICLVTGWPMAGVDYRPSNDLSGDALTLLREAWGALSSLFKRLGEGAREAFDIVLRALEGAGQLASDALRTTGEWLDTFIQYLRGFADALFQNVIGPGLELMTGSKQVCLVDASVLGMRLRIETNQADLALTGAKNIVKLTMGYSIGTDSISVSGRVLKTSSQDYRLLINGTLTRSNSRLSLVVDPFMTAFPHFLEVRGWYEGNQVELNMPEVSGFHQYTYSLQDMPGLGEVLKNLPSPVPGTKLQFNVGTTLKFAYCDDPHPLINEFESNPSGKDSGMEWVEIFNPSSQAISLSGWSILTNHGKSRLDEIGDVILLPLSRIIYTLPGQGLDNGDLASFPYADCISLLDQDGKRVDVTPIVMDKMNDGRTWQRADDGSSEWEFKLSTKGRANSQIRYQVVTDQEVTPILEIFMKGMLERFEAGGLSVDSLAFAIESQIAGLAQELVDRWVQCIVDAALFLDISVVDATGMLGMTTRFSLSIGSQFLLEAWDWTCKVIGAIMRAPTNAVRAIVEMAPSHGLLENIWFGCQVFVKMRSPDVFGPGGAAIIKAGLNLKLNLASLGGFIGKDLGEKKLVAGICFSMAIPDGLRMANSWRSDAVTEVWLAKLTIRRI